jgi:hypothetical protein
MATERPLDEAPQSAGAALTASPERADEIFLEGPRPRFEDARCSRGAVSPSGQRAGASTQRSGYELS